MDSRSLIDAQFDRAVEIVQSLPKNGPIQTGYEDKLTMYSLYKQATVGNVKSPRPGMFDMLGRAKWDAWAQHKDLDSHEAKWLYVDALLRVLRKYSDKTVARDLVQELESYNGDASNLVMSASLSRSYSESSGSTISDGDHPSQTIQLSVMPVPPPAQHQEADAESSSSEDTDDEPTDIRPQRPQSVVSRSHTGRPQSSLSGRASYRTPLASSFAIASPPPRIPSTQPLPGFETPSAFADRPAAVSPVYYRPSGSSFGPYTSSLPPTSPHEAPYPIPPAPAHSYTQVPRSALERALENVQAHVAALTERIETLESQSPRHISSASSRRSNTPEQHLRELRERGFGARKWTMDDWGMWSLVLNPVSRCLEVVFQLTRFFTTSKDRSPALTVLRRLALDVSFLACVVLLIRTVWRRSGLRRKEVLAALVALWRAIVGSQPQRSMADKGI